MKRTFTGSTTPVPAHCESAQNEDAPMRDHRNGHATVPNFTESQRTATLRGGWSTWMSLIAFAGLSVPVAAWGFLPRFLGGEPAPNILTAEVTVGPFVNRVLEQGEVESSSSVEVRCEVRARNSSGTNILEIVPEGTRVQPGDLLVKLDDSALQQELIQQQIVCSGSESLYIEGRAALESATLALSEYEQGTFREQEETLESALVVAQENMRRADEYLGYSRKLAERGYVSQVQLEADKFAVDKARKELEVAQTKLEVLRKFSRQKMLTQLRADIETAKARLDAREKTWQLDKVRLNEIEEQIAKCVIRAPAAGQVVYANDPRRSTNGEVLIAEGLPVRERQVIVRLPDPSKMRAVAKVHESRISQVRKGLTAEVSTDALPDQILMGTVNSVSEYPLPSTSVFTAHVKEYAVEIDIQSPPPELRPGMTAQVNVLVEHYDSVTQIPISAAISRGGHFFCAIPREDGSFETRAIEVSSSNESNLVVTEGLHQGELVVLNPDEAVERLLDLPEVEKAPAENALDSNTQQPEQNAAQTASRSPGSAVSGSKSL